MDEYVIKQKIQQAYFEPRAPQELVEQVILRAQAVTMGVEAQKQLEAAPAQQVSQLAARGLIGQLAAVSELPQGTEPRQLAEQLEQEPAFQAALLGGNVVRRLQSGELLQQVVEQTPQLAQEQPQVAVPQKQLPNPG